MEENKQQLLNEHDMDNILQSLSKKGTITINNIHIDESVTMFTQPKEQNKNKFFNLSNVDKIIEAGKIIGKIASIGAPIVLPKLLSNGGNPVQNLLGNINPNANKQLLLTSSEKISNSYIENVKKENENGKYELFFESPKNITPLWNFLVDLVEIDIGNEYEFTEMNEFTNKFLPFLKRKDTILVYKESKDSNDKCKIEEIVFHLYRDLKNKNILKIRIESVSIKNSNEIDEIPDNKIEIIPQSN